MRISTQMLFQQGLNGILEQQSRSARTLEQLSTGQRVNRPSDDPAAAARIQELDRAVAQQGVYVENIARTEQRLATEEGALTSASTIVRRVRELAVQGASDTVGEEGRKLIATELRQRLDEMVAIGNSRSGEGEFIFAGAQSQTPPFAASAGVVSYAGDSVQRELMIGAGTTMADGDTGDNVFMRIRDGNGAVSVAPAAANTGTGVSIVGAGTPLAAGTSYTIRFTGADAYEVVDQDSNTIASGAFADGDNLSFNGIGVVVNGNPAAGDEFTVAPARLESVFATIDKLAAAFEAPANTDASRTGQRQAIDDALGQLDRVESRLLEVRAGVGGRLSTLADVQDTQESVRFSLEKLVSEVRDLDFAEAASRLQQELFTLQAAQQSFTRIQGNSLFNFI
ncbi:flagellar hook-associated protein 3 [Kineobactrum sediminis]|uniref:Flagellar hook-associated protein 3 n=1 Tax=Kineobactrum sediminis TaxID=1905677 RepID=A0A2N5Y6F7_9GAMM|nr:flagellar hook-associated protein FlgL [Kineobactrum sediminis]PLW83984.1 flagellar hook-associated protein 3 [Kineobactrum sediminis]